MDASHAPVRHALLLRVVSSPARVAWAGVSPIRGVCLTKLIDSSSIPALWAILIPYTIWALVIDKAPFKGGRPKRWARRFPLWKYFCRESRVGLDFSLVGTIADGRILPMQVSWRGGWDTTMSHR